MAARSAVRASRIPDSHTLHCNEIASKIGLGAEAVRRFVDDNKINALTLLIDVGSKRFSPHDVTAAVCGAPGNALFVTVVQKYGDGSPVNLAWSL